MTNELIGLAIAVKLGVSLAGFMVVRKKLQELKRVKERARDLEVEIAHLKYQVALQEKMMPGKKSGVFLTARGQNV